MTVLVSRHNRTFKVQWAKVGDIEGWVVFEKELEPGITWSCVSGAHRTKSEAYADIDRMTK